MVCDIQGNEVCSQADFCLAAASECSANQAEAAIAIANSLHP